MQQMRVANGNNVRQLIHINKNLAAWFGENGFLALRTNLPDLFIEYLDIACGFMDKVLNHPEKETIMDLTSESVRHAVESTQESTQESPNKDAELVTDVSHNYTIVPEDEQQKNIVMMYAITTRSARCADYQQYLESWICLSKMWIECGPLNLTKKSDDIKPSQEDLKRASKYVNLVLDYTVDLNFMNKMKNADFEDRNQLKAIFIYISIWFHINGCTARYTSDPKLFFEYIDAIIDFVQKLRNHKDIDYIVNERAGPQSEQEKKDHNIWLTFIKTEDQKVNKNAELINSVQDNPQIVGSDDREKGILEACAACTQATMPKINMPYFWDTLQLLADVGKNGKL